MDIPFRPFTILAIGPFAPIGESPSGVRTVAVDTVADAFSALEPRLWIPLPKDICPDGGVTIAPRRIKDLTPEGILGSAGYPKDLVDAKELIRKSEGAIEPAAIAEKVRSQWPGLPIDLSVGASSPSKAAAAGGRVDDILSMVAMEGAPAKPVSATGGVSAWVHEIDRVLSAVMAAVFVDEGFRSFEASWRGIECLLKQGPAGAAKDTRLAIVNVSREGLPQVLDELSGMLDNDPPELILIDMELDNSPVSIDLAERIAAFAEGLLTPTAVAMSAGFLGLKDWSDLGHLAYLRHHLDDNPVYAGWTKLRTFTSANWLFAACNGFLVRSRYGGDGPSHSVPFEEGADLWISPVWGLGTLAAQSAARSGWPTRLTDGDNARIEGLALHCLEEGIEASTQMVLSVDRLAQFGEIGLAPLMGIAMRDMAFMPAARSVSGEPMGSLMFFSRLTGFLIRLREEYGSSVAANDPAGWLTEALETFFRLSGGHIPNDLSIDASHESGRLFFEIALTPPSAIIPGGRRLTFTFAW